MDGFPLEKIREYAVWGCACVVDEPGKGLGTGENYQFARRQAAREANAAARALFDAGAREAKALFGEIGTVATKKYGHGLRR